MVDLATQHGVGLRLQMAGQGLLSALAQGIEGAAAAAAQTAEALRTRDISGDEPLAEQLEAALGLGPIPLRANVPVDLDELAAAMDMDPDMGASWLHPTTGELLIGLDPFATGELGGDELPDDFEDWIRVEPRDTGEAWNDMASFTESVEDQAFGARLLRAIEGRGAFRRFKDILFERPEIRERWFAWSEDRSWARARVFLAEHRLQPAVRVDATAQAPEV